MYREAQLAYIISDEKNPTNHPIYAVGTDFGACILQIEESQKASMQRKKPTNQAEGEQGSQVWKMFFDGACSKDVLTQPDANGRRAKWIAKLIEFNIELKPTKLVRGQING